MNKNEVQKRIENAQRELEKAQEELEEAQKELKRLEEKQIVSGIGTHNNERWVFFQNTKKLREFLNKSYRDDQIIYIKPDGTFGFDYQNFDPSKNSYWSNVELVERKENYEY